MLELVLALATLWPIWLGVALAALVVSQWRRRRRDG
jgi:hypothetical protein